MAQGPQTHDVMAPVNPSESERRAFLDGFQEAVTCVENHGLEHARWWQRLLAGEDVHMIDRPRTKDHPGGLG